MHQGSELQTAHKRALKALLANRLSMWYLASLDDGQEATTGDMLSAEAPCWPLGRTLNRCAAVGRC